MSRSSRCAAAMPTSSTCRRRGISSRREVSRHPRWRQYRNSCQRTSLAPSDAVFRANNLVRLYATVGLLEAMLVVGGVALGHHASVQAGRHEAQDRRWAMRQRDVARLLTLALDMQDPGSHV